MGSTAELASMVVDTDFDDLDSHDTHHAKLAILDYVGVAMYGSNHEVGQIVGQYVSDYSGGDDSTVIGRGTASPPGAALANGSFGHAIDYDDTFESIIIHPTSPIFAASMAIGESASASGKDVLTGYFVGCESAYVIGNSIAPAHFECGWHMTGTVGTIGAAIASGYILNLSQEALQNAIGIAASESSSLKKNFGTMTKPLHAGHAAEMGVRAALLAKRGFTADKSIIEGKLGYGKIMTGGEGHDESVLTEDFGNEWAINDIGFKPYPSGVITHAAMDSLREIVIEEDLKPDDVDEIIVTLADDATDMLIHENPSDALQAKFSIEFCLAAILRERDAGVHEFTDEYVSEEETQEIISIVTRDFESELFGVEYASYGARIKVRSGDNEYMNETEFAPGSPNNPVTEDRLEAKFRECGETQYSNQELDNLIQIIHNLEQNGNFESLVEFLR